MAFDQKAFSEAIGRHLPEETGLLVNLIQAFEVAKADQLSMSLFENRLLELVNKRKPRTIVAFGCYMVLSNTNK